MNRCANLLQDVKSLSPAQKTALSKNNFRNASDIVLTPPNEIAKKLRTSLSEAQAIVETVCKEIAKNSLRIAKIAECSDEKFTTGDSALDRAIGGGIRTGMVWELVGESASGKTQLALQLCLLVQLRPMLGGLLGSACYLSTHTKLATQRLSQLVQDHPLLSPSICGLSDIHTVAVPTIELLLRTLTITFPTLVEDLRGNPDRKPVKLVIIDSISALFHTSGKPSSFTLFERSRALSELSRVVHEIAARHNIAFIIINEVTDVFNDYYSNNHGPVLKDDILYREQARWFGSAHSHPAENAKEACLGLVWANQVNVRIMLTRTNRRRYLDEPGPPTKRRQKEGNSAVSEATPDTRERDNGIGQSSVIRRLSVIFNSVSTPASVDFIVTNAGISAVHDEVAKAIVSPDSQANFNHISDFFEPEPPTRPEPPVGADHFISGAGDCVSQKFVNARIISATLEGPSSSGSSADASFEEAIPSTYPEVDEFDDEARYWEGLDEIPDVAPPDIDFDGLERSQIEEGTGVSQAAVSGVGNG
ncbi:RHP57 [Sanghuangporus weigelae]